MKQSVLLIIFLSLLSCSYTQVVTTMALDETMPSTKGGNYIHENDTLSIAYSFWGLGGSIAMKIYNKTDKPIYVDWNKSSFVFNGTKRSYYRDRSISTGVSYGEDVAVALPLFDGAVAGGKNVQVSKGITEREERITFIPPKTTILRRFGSITTPMTYSKKTREGKDIKINGIKVHEMPLKRGEIEFRSFVTYSTTEGFEQEYYIDAGFYGDKVLDVRTHMISSFISPKSYYTSSFTR